LIPDRNAIGKLDALRALLPEECRSIGFSHAHQLQQPLCAEQAVPENGWNVTFLRQMIKAIQRAHYIIALFMDRKTIAWVGSRPRGRPAILVARWCLVAAIPPDSYYYGIFRLMMIRFAGWAVLFGPRQGSSSIALWAAYHRP
jgi:hypothetical protein